MRRLALAVAAALVWGTPPPATASYVGHVRSATAAFRFRGLDGHVITAAVTRRSSGLGGSTPFVELEVRLTDCARQRCVTSPTYVKVVTPEPAHGYETKDLSLTFAKFVIGGTALLVSWESDAGYGALPPEPSTSGGVALTTRRNALAVVLAGPMVDGKIGQPVRCTDERASVSSALVVRTTERTGDRWPAAEPPGLRVKPRSHRTFTCA